MSLVLQTAYELYASIARGELQPREVVDAFLQRIDAVEPRVKAFITVAAGTAREQADALAAAGPKGPGAGVPIAIKDNLSTAGIRTTAASRMLENYVPPFDATPWARLRQAGLPLLGKANLDEFAMGSSTESSAFHPTYNPWDPGRVPGGSSGGSAAAVAAHLAPWALGSDTGGSIRQPAALCGIVGLKPTYGRVSRHGLIPLAPSLDCVGPMAKDVRDAALLLQLIAGPDPLDPTSYPGDVPDFMAALGRDVKGLRVGLPTEYFGAGVDAEVAGAVREAARLLEGLGAHVEEVSLPHTEDGVPAYYVLVSAEASSALGRYDGVRYGHRSREARDSVQLFENSRAEAFGPEVKWRIILGTFALSGERKETLYRQAQRVRALVRRDFEEAFQRFDVLLAPTSPTPAFPLQQHAGQQGAAGAGEGNALDAQRVYAADTCTIPASLAGIPAISVPCGLSGGGLPLGMQIMGKPFDEETVLRVAYAYEQAAGAARWRLGEEVAAVGH